ncbi:MAG: tRNA-modifying protein YgfZ [Gammaproteobacteria bacterium]|nr:tRNA-modifying protein YgfZ [Gammaproteobacteria bacterium]
MNPTWQQLLREAGAVMDAGIVPHFGDAARELRAAAGGEIISDLSHLGIIEVDGEDASRFLGGQLTSDVLSLGADRSSLSAWCTPQGRALALFRVLRAGQAYRLLLPAELAEPTVRRMRMYVLRSRVRITDPGDALACMGVSGAGAAAALARDLALPQSPEAVSDANGLSIVRLPGVSPRLLLLGPPEGLAPLWRRLAAAAPPAGAPAWDFLDITAGLPQVFAATSGKFIPLTLNLELLGGISFGKGCYTGQEIIARMRYRGHLRQRMYIGRADAVDVPPPGARLAVEGAEMSAGEVVQATPHPEGGVVFTAVTQMELAQTDRVHLLSAAGPAVRWSRPPYNIELP